MKWLSLTDKKPLGQYLTVFLCAFALMLIIMLPFVIFDGGYMVYIGTITVSRSPFILRPTSRSATGS